MFNRNKDGFTLIELLVVIAIIGVLSSFILSAFNIARKNSRDTRRLADTRELKTALEIYYDSVQDNPAALSDLVPSYIPALPIDPLDGITYAYFKCADGQYHLGASLEDSNNAALNQDLDAISANCIGSIIDSPDDDGCANEASRFCYDINN